MKALGSSASLRLSAKNPPSRLLAKMPSPRLLAKDHPRWPRGLIKEAKALLVIDLTQESCEAPLLEKGELLERMPHRFLKPTKGILKKSSEPGGSPSRFAAHAHIASSCALAYGSTAVGGTVRSK